MEQKKVYILMFVELYSLENRQPVGLQRGAILIRQMGR